MVTRGGALISRLSSKSSRLGVCELTKLCVRPLRYWIAASAAARSIVNGVFGKVVFCGGARFSLSSPNCTGTVYAICLLGVMTLGCMFGAARNVVCSSSTIADSSIVAGWTIFCVTSSWSATGNMLERVRRLGLAARARYCGCASLTTVMSSSLLDEVSITGDADLCSRCTAPCSVLLALATILQACRALLISCSMVVKSTRAYASSRKLRSQSASSCTEAICRQCCFSVSRFSLCTVWIASSCLLRCCLKRSLALSYFRYHWSVT